MNLTPVGTSVVVVGIPSIIGVLRRHLSEQSAPSCVHSFCQLATPITKIHRIHPIPARRNYVPDLLKVRIPVARCTDTPKGPPVMVVIHAGSETHIVFAERTPRTFKENFPVLLTPNRYYEIALHQILVDFYIIRFTIFVIVQELRQNIRSVLHVIQGCPWGCDYIHAEDIHEFVKGSI